MRGRGPPPNHLRVVVTDRITSSTGTGGPGRAWVEGPTPAFGTGRRPMTRVPTEPSWRGARSPQWTIRRGVRSGLRWCGGRVDCCVDPAAGVRSVPADGGGAEDQDAAFDVVVDVGGVDEQVL